MKQNNNAISAKNNIKIRTFEIPIFNIDIVVVIDDDFFKINELYGLNMNQDEMAGHAVTTQHPEYTGKAEFFVLFKPWTLDHNTVSHEVVHLINFIYWWKGIKLDEDNDENQAYLTGYVSQLVMEFRDEFLGLPSMTKILNGKFPDKHYKARKYK